MIFDISVVGFSLLLLMYWFRFTCVLMLGVKPVRDYSKQVAAANQLKVFDVQNRLAPALAGRVQNLDELQQMLDRDYRMLSYLLKHAANFNTAGFQLEETMLKINYQIVKRAYCVSKRFSPVSASQRLSEMASIITYFANMIGERGALATA